MNYITNFIWVIISCFVVNAQCLFDLNIITALKESNSIVLQSLLKTQILTKEECKGLLTVAQMVKEQRERKLMLGLPHLKDAKLFSTTVIFLLTGLITLKIWLENQLDPKDKNDKSYKISIIFFGGMASVSALYAIKLLYKKYVSMGGRKKYLGAIEIVKMLSRPNNH